MNYSLLPFLLIISFFSINLPICDCANDIAEYGNCRQPISCGSVESNISYPFWGANRAEYCGKSGFQVTCNGDVPLITMRNINFRILDMISYATTPSVKVAREDYWGTICPSKYVPTNLNFSLFAYSSGLVNVSFYYGCSSSTPGSAVTTNSQACNASVTVSYLTQTQSDKINPVTGGASTTEVLIPVYESASVALDSNTTDIQTAIDGGFGLDVLNSDTGLCNNCFASGGVCGQNTSTGAFLCLCQTTSSSTTICTEYSSESSPTLSSSDSRSHGRIIGEEIKKEKDDSHVYFFIKQLR